MLQQKDSYDVNFGYSNSIVMTLRYNDNLEDLADTTTIYLFYKDFNLY